MASNSRPLAIVTGASSGIGYELARWCAENGFDLLVAADEPAIHEAADDFRALATSVDAVETDLATIEGEGFMPPPKDGRSKRCWPMPAGASERPSSTRISMRSGTWSTPTSPARST
jgi:short chain dehydrogenase